MNNETNRLAQIIANAADKELAVRQDGQPRRQDKAAALAVEEEYLFIRRDEVPKSEIVEVAGHPHVDVGSKAGTWPCQALSAKYVRATGLEYIAVAEALERWSSEHEVLKRERDARREELAGDFAGAAYDWVPLSLQDAIDRIIELEGKAA